MGNFWRAALLIAACAAAVVGYFLYSRYADAHPSTDDAYVNANIVRIAPLVGGAVQDVYVDNDQFVRKGAVLFSIDSAVPKIAVDLARSQLEPLVQGGDATSVAIRTAVQAVRVSQVSLESAQTGLTLFRAEDSGDEFSKRQLDAGFKAAAAARSRFDEARESLDDATAQLGSGDIDNAAAILTAVASLQRAELDVARTNIVAPISGWIAGLSVRPGTVLQPGGSVLALVSEDQWWIDANFKETDLERIQIGQLAAVKLDMYPSQQFSGTVRSISIGSGAAFSLLRPENATGNWVKVTQRFPVRIDLTGVTADDSQPLRVGASATVKIDATAAQPNAQ